MINAWNIIKENIDNPWDLLWQVPLVAAYVIAGILVLIGIFAAGGML